MADSRTIGVIEVETLTSVNVRHIAHGQELDGMSPVVVISGTLCPEGSECKWCDDLRARVRSRRVF